MQSKVIKDLNLSHNDFSICPEITTKLSRLKYDIIEIPISYRGRNYSEGKKIYLSLLIQFNHKYEKSFCLFKYCK